LVTVALVMFTNAFAFSDGSLTVARVILFLALALAVGFGVVMPLLRLNRRTTARQAEEAFPEFEERLLTFAERNQGSGSDPFLELLAEDALPVAQRAEPAEVVTSGRILGFLSAAAGTIALLVWLGVSGPGFLGYGTSLLWAGAPSTAEMPFYSIHIAPGSRSVRRGSDQLVTANLMGFQETAVRLYARYEGTSKWEEVQMLPEPGGVGFEFLFAGLPESVDYYVEAGMVS
ncbi:MAG: hypothetical protein GY953_09885, partial [bacterium]|nr:hypothetical protein [bacterium]